MLDDCIVDDNVRVVNLRGLEAILLPLYWPSLVSSVHSVEVRVTNSSDFAVGWTKKVRRGQHNENRFLGNGRIPDRRHIVPIFNYCIIYVICTYLGLFYFY